MTPDEIRARALGVLLNDAADCELWRIAREVYAMEPALRRARRFYDDGDPWGEIMRLRRTLAETEEKLDRARRGQRAGFWAAAACAAMFVGSVILHWWR